MMKSYQSGIGNHVEFRVSTINSFKTMCSQKRQRACRLSTNESIFSFKATLFVFMFPVQSLMDLGALSPMH